MAEAAGRLDITEATVKTHPGRILTTRYGTADRPCEGIGGFLLASGRIDDPVAEAAEQRRWRREAERLSHLTERRRLFGPPHFDTDAAPPMEKVSSPAGWRW